MSKFNPTSLNTYADKLLNTASESSVRGVMVMSGSAIWCRQQAAHLLQGREIESIWWVGKQPYPGTELLEWSKARTRLGREVEWLVIDAHDGFDAEGFGALSGTVRAGGLLLLLTPAFEEWHRFVDPKHTRMACYPYDKTDVSGHFLARFAHRIEAADGVALLREGELLPKFPHLPPVPDAEERGSIYANGEQRQAVEAIHHVEQGHSHRPLVLSADRGRGKSAALGIAAAQLLHEGLMQIVVTGPRIAATDALFAHAAALLPGCVSRRGRLLWQGGCIEFVAPDALLQTPREAQLLLVDEAAAIPASLLERLLGHYPRIVFATTIHGYEGTGRGFVLRFQKLLDSMTPQWRALQLEAPVRWATGDPLEKLSFDALMLDAEPIEAEFVEGASVDNCYFERLDPSLLAENEADLRQLFGLLVLAHYRTSPNDLRQLLDAPGQSLHVLRHRGHIIAVALLAHEGGLEPELAQQVMLGHRRVQGHLLPQSLANHAGLVEAAQLRIARVMRIAVHPALQRRGLGGQLLQQLEKSAQAQGSDLIGASFGADSELLRFWFRHGLLPVRLGLSREASSGSHAVMVLMPLSTAGETLFAIARQRFVESLPDLLAEPLAGLEIEVADALLAVTPISSCPELGDYDWSDLKSFAFGLRGYENCMTAIHKLVRHVWADGTVNGLEGAQRLLLEEKVLQRHTWQQLCCHHGFAGRKVAQQALREVVARLLRHYHRA
jgi:tRNA(Met) cytidine acetyltransferase